jgi:hypothetical protein
VPVTDFEKDNPLAEKVVIPVFSEFDVVKSRTEARTQALLAGFGIEDQARISMATSSLAHALSLGKLYVGEIEISVLAGTRRPGVKVVCTTRSITDYRPVLHQLRGGAWDMMVDELSISLLPDNDVQVVAVKWLDIQESYPGSLEAE